MKPLLSFVLVTFVCGSACARSGKVDGHDVHNGEHNKVQSASESVVTERSGTKDTVSNIGSATMQEDGTLILYLVADDGQGTRGLSMQTYAPDDAKYASILKHLGQISVGESVPIPPFTE